MALPVVWRNKTARSPDCVASIVIASRLPYHHFTPHICTTLTSVRVTDRIPLIADGASGAENVVENSADRDSPSRH